MRLIFICFLLMSAFSIMAQTIPNSSFENWSNVGSYEVPDSWDTPNDYTSGLSIYPTSKETNTVKDGNACVYLETSQVLTFKVPGMVTLGDFSVNIITQETNIDGGIEFTYKPEKFKGWYIYDPQGGDECYIAAFLLKQITDGYDTIARAEFSTTAQVLNWTSFDVDFIYESTETPTHMNIAAISSNFFGSPQVNSALYLDALEFEYSSSINEELTPFAFFNSYNSLLSLPENRGDAFNIKVFDASGKLIESFYTDQQQCYIHQMMKGPSGIYFINVTGETKKCVLKVVK